MRKGELTRRKIIERAAPLFNKRGFNGCSMQDISAATGLEKGSLYTPCKARAGNLDQVSGSIEKLQLHIDNFVRKPPFAGGCPLLNTAIDADDGNLTLYHKAQEALAAWVALLKQIVEQGQKSGEIRGLVDPEAFATLVISLLEGAFFTSRLQKSKAPLRLAQQHLSRYIEESVRKIPD
jgi:TetR/AcrR family transcriptional repressor of nem operon